MSDVQYPSLPGLTYSVLKAPVFHTRKQTSVSGRETTLNDWLNPRYDFTLTYSVLHDEAFWDVGPADYSTHYRIMMQFFMDIRGGFDTFVFYDPDDMVINNMYTLPSVADGSNSQFQLARQWANFGLNTLQPVYGISDLVDLRVGGVSQDPSMYTIDPNTGIITFYSPPAADSVIYASYYFFYRCRLSEDTLSFEQFMHNLYELKTVKFRSVIA